MCGRYNFTEEDNEEIEKILRKINEERKDYADDVFNMGEIFPTHTVPVLALEAGKPTIQLMKWGFPKWNNKGVIINARSEDAAEKKSFAQPLREKRCVVLSTGFFEWQKLDPKLPKTKYLFNHPISPMLYMAGAFNTFKSEQRDCFVIFTRDANKHINDVHSRMPVILYKNELKRWLADGESTHEFFKRDDIELTRQAV